jgi:hypothetical protein
MAGTDRSDHDRRLLRAMMYIRNLRIRRREISEAIEVLEGLLERQATEQDELAERLLTSADDERGLREAFDGAERDARVAHVRRHQEPVPPRRPRGR